MSEHADTAPIYRTPGLSLPDALWRVSIMRDLESDGRTLDERQVSIFERALAVIAAHGPSANTTDTAATGDDGAPKTFGPAGNGNGSAPVPMVTEKQLACLRREIPRRDTSSPSVRLIADKLAAGDDPLTTISRKQASTALGILFAAKFAIADALVSTFTTAAPVNAPARKSSPDVTEEGSYQVGSDVYRVRRSKSSDRLYAELLNSDTGKFAYDRGAIYRISADDRMSVEEAAQYGREHGHCVVCSRKITREDSLARGMGKVCAAKV